MEGSIASSEGLISGRKSVVHESTLQESPPLFRKIPQLYIIGKEPTHFAPRDLTYHYFCRARPPSKLKDGSLSPRGPLPAPITTDFQQRSYHLSFISGNNRIMVMMIRGLFSPIHSM